MLNLQKMRPYLGGNGPPVITEAIPRPWTGVLADAARSKALLPRKVHLSPTDNSLKMMMMTAELPQSAWRMAHPVQRASLQGCLELIALIMHSICTMVWTWLCHDGFEYQGLT